MADYVKRCRGSLVSEGLCQRNAGHQGFCGLEPDGRTLKQLAQEAYDVQDASNLSGVVNSFYKTLCDLRQIPGLEGNQAYQNHAITRAWVDKIASLTGMSGRVADRNVIDAFNEVSRLKNET